MKMTKNILVGVLVEQTHHYYYITSRKAENQLMYTPFRHQVSEIKLQYLQLLL